MEVRRVADTFLRSQSSPLAGLLAPAPTIRWQAGRQWTCRSPLHLSRRRTFVTTASKYSFNPAATTTAASSSSGRGREKETSEDSNIARTNIDEAAKNLGWLQGGRSRSGGSQKTHEQNRLSRDRELAMNGGSSADDIFKAMNTYSRFGSPSTSGIDLSRMKNPASQNRPESAADMMSAITTMLPKPEKIPIRLSPSTGRSISIQGNVDVARGFRLMERTCAQNNIKKDAMYQRFHERRGMKKKRLRRVRWRARFMEGFRATVSRVKKLRKQGW